MGYSNRKPYYDLDKSQLDFFGGSSRFLKTSLDKESQFEKPYLESEYPIMHLRLPNPTWPSRLPRRPVGAFGGIGDERRTRFIFPPPRCSIIGVSSSPRFGLDCGETVILTFWEPDSFFVQKWTWKFTITSTSVNTANIVLEELGETTFGYAIALTADAGSMSTDGVVLVCGTATTSNVPLIWSGRFQEEEAHSLFSNQVFNEVLSKPGIVHCCEEVLFNCTPCVITEFYANYDGDIARVDADWDTAHDTTTGEFVSDTNAWVQIRARKSAVPSYWIDRGYISFDLTTARSECIIASCSLFCSFWAAGIPDIKIGIQEGTFSSPISVTDYASFTGSSFGDVTKAYTDDYEWIEIPFNTLGIVYIQSVLGGIAKVCMREYEHDYLDISPDEVIDFYGEFETTETANKPYLKVTYK